MAFLYITKFDLNLRQLKAIPESDHDDIAAGALHKFLCKFLRVPNTQHYGDIDHWLVSSAAYVLTRFNDENYQLQPNDDDDDDDYDEDYNRKLAARKEADPFLRNGFFQDPALIREDYDNQRLLVASYGHWNQYTAASSNIKTFALTIPSQPSVKDRSILEAVQRVVVRDVYVPNVYSEIVLGYSQFKAPSSHHADPVVSQQQLMSLRQDVEWLVRRGGSVARSMALHAACQYNSPSVVALLLEIEPHAINSRNRPNLTPLIVAAKNASDRCTIRGIEDTKVIDLLLELGADSNLTDPNSGMTAYDFFYRTSKFMSDMTYPRHHRASFTALEKKLCPALGAVGNKCRGSSIGIVDYGPVDEECIGRSSA